MARNQMETEQVETEAPRPTTTTTTRDKPPFNELHSLKRVASKTFKLMSKTTNNNNPDVASSSSDSVTTLKGQLEEANREVISMKSDVQKMKENETQLAQKEAFIAALNQELHTFKSSIIHKDHILSHTNKRVEDLEAELERINDSHNKLFHANQDLIHRLQQQQDADNDKIQRLQNELELQRNRTANDEIIMLRNELNSAMEAEEKSKQAMDELAAVIKEVAVEANQTQDKLASAEEENQTLRNTIAWLKTEAEDSLLAWSAKEVEFVKCIKKEEDDKANLQEENNKLLQELKEFEEKSHKLFKETEKIRDAFKAVMEENSQLKREKTLARLKLHETPPHWEEEEGEHKKRGVPSSYKSQEERKSVSSPPSTKNGAKSSGSSGGVEEREHKRLLSSSLLPSFKKETKKDTSTEKEVMKGHGHMKPHGAFYFNPKTVFPIPGMASKSKEVSEVDDNDDGLTDSIFDLVSSPPKAHHRRKSSLEGHKSICLEEFEHEEGTTPHSDDMEVERAGSHGPKRRMLLRKFGDFWRWKAQAPTGTHPHNHHDYQTHQTQNLDEKVVTT